MMGCSRKLHSPANGHGDGSVVHSKNRLVEKTTNLIGWPNIGYILVVLTNILVN